MIDLYKACADIVNQVPKGRVTTYGAVAEALGDSIAKRAVGVMLNTYGPPIKMPCHRVVYSGGGLGGFAYGLPSKMKMLGDEGVFEDKGKIARFEEILFDDFKTDYPLKAARKEQLALAKKVKITGGKMPKKVLGLDASYRGTKAYVAGVLYDLERGKVLETRTAVTKVDFPYIPTYLGFREVPLYRELVGMADGDTVIMADGNGTLHPFGLGLACHIGVEYGLPAIGVAKTLLRAKEFAIEGSRGETRTIRLGAREVGREVMTARRGNPVYVSPGHMVSMEIAVETVRKTARLKLPEPVRLAHLAATEMRRSDA